MMGMRPLFQRSQTLKTSVSIKSGSVLHVEGEPGCSLHVFHFGQGIETTRANIMTEIFSNSRLVIVFIAFFFISCEIKYYLVAINKRYAFFVASFCANSAPA